MLAKFVIGFLCLVVFALASILCSLTYKLIRYIINR